MTMADHLPLVTGALRSPFKRPRPDADFPRTRLVRSGVRVDLARLAAYERVCGFPTGDDDLPLTYPHILAFPLAMRLMGGRDFPLPLLGLVHTSIELTRHTALSATGEYELAVHLAGLAPHRRGTEATVATEALADGEVVWESRSTYLSRHRTDGVPQAGSEEHGPPCTDGVPQAGPEKHRPPSTGHVPQAAPEKHTPPSTDDAPPPGGQERKPLTAGAEWRLGADIGRRYAAVSGDRNPIHLYPLTARLFGFPRPIAHGMWTVARCLAAHGTPEAVLVRAEFRAPVPLPGTVEYAAEGGRFALRRGDRLHVSGAVQPLASRARR
ncbi:MaoC family dehydratase [Streptomyces gossypiisoli]|uniref:MaoC family dehydratase n=1 Tax=Streptomyces gossypiisoli TaxID=2748864 RepID=UPI0038CD332B